jgi:hypothetical protein
MRGEVGIGMDEGLDIPDGDIRQHDGLPVLFNILASVS